MKHSIIYNISTKTCKDAFNICKFINKNPKKFNIKEIYNKERILFIKFNEEVSDKSIKKINKLIKEY
jgi:hypothetical protein